ncbi:MAG: SprT family zinc-dependent metalloprotease [Candidatus Saccharicenans sp.]|nr:SprT family zinc-dependent metalloprotease [Candidatus Saccharicenans sp.]
MSKKIKWKLIRSRRRTVGLEVSERGELIVRAPKDLSRGSVLEVLKEHRRWITKKLAEVEERQKFHKPRKFEEGENFLYLGREYPLRLEPGSRRFLAFDGRCFIMSSAARGGARELFLRLYRKLAKKYLSARLKRLAALNGFRFGKFRLSSARTRWGSCSAQGTISLTWRLIMAPPEIIDYVIVHELAHTKEKNHSRAFWNLVGHHIPDYKEKRRWLKKNGFWLNL